ASKRNTEPDQLALDPPVSPAGVLARQTHDQLAHDPPASPDDRDDDADTSSGAPPARDATAAASPASPKRRPRPPRPRRTERPTSTADPTGRAPVDNTDSSPDLGEHSRLEFSAPSRRAPGVSSPHAQHQRPRRRRWRVLRRGRALPPGLARHRHHQELARHG